MLSDAADQRRVVAARYARVAEEYEELWAPVLRDRVRDLIDRLDLGAAQRIVDVGCGTGSGVRVLVERAPHATVVGVDLTVEMLRVARQFFAGPLAAMDAQRLALRPASVDVVVCTFALHHVADPRAAVSSWAQTVVPGGTIAVAGWGVAHTPLAETVWTEELDAAGAPPVTLNARSDAAFDTPKKMASFLEAAGCTDVDAWSVALGHVWTPEGLLEHLTRYAASRERLSALPHPDAVLERIRARFAALPADAFEEPARCVLAIAHAAHS